MAGLFSFRPSEDASRARVTIDLEARSSVRVSPLLFGKFCEHLGSNIYGGMAAQVLRNPTFGAWPFAADAGAPDGGVTSEYDPERIAERIRGRAARCGLPFAEALIEARTDGLAFWWLRAGERDEVAVSPDVGPHGGRAQRVEVRSARPDEPAGIRQHVHLPLHRIRRYEYRVVIRSPDGCAVRFALRQQDGAAADAAGLEDIASDWTTRTGTLTLPDSAPADALYELALELAEPGSFVIDRVLLYPADHDGGADPDVIRLLKESRLSILRWPGGNFVSGYRWRNGVGPVDARPTVPNPAWGGLEYHLFGTDEFVAFCRSVGCEPLICVNAGDGGAAEAAQWVQYCNGKPCTPLGALRAEGGHPEPYRIRYWEIGNEIYGRWQVGRTTPAGYADRYRAFVRAMRAEDPQIQFLACGSPQGPDHEWNRLLVDRCAEDLRSITDHILVPGGVPWDTAPESLYLAHLAYPVLLDRQYRRQKEVMEAAGIRGARVAITELQLFGRIREAEGKPRRLTPETMPTPATQAEAVHAALIYHMAIRAEGHIEMITHSATVNHGGGLRKERERVYPNPIHHARSLYADLAGGTPVAVTLEAAALEATEPFGRMEAVDGAPLLDVIAVLDSDGGTLRLAVVSRGVSSPVRLEVPLEGISTAAEASVVELASPHFADANTLAEPDRIRPRRYAVAIREGVLELEVPPYGLLHAAVPLSQPAPAE